MISVLDQGVGEVVKALKDSRMLKDTVIVFYSDNGGPTIGMHSTNASNYPLRGVSDLSSNFKKKIENFSLVRSKSSRAGRAQ